MCGSIGILGRDDVSGRILEGLSRPEDHGDDRAGLARVEAAGRVSLRHGIGNLAAFKEGADGAPSRILAKPVAVA